MLKCVLDVLFVFVFFQSSFGAALDTSGKQSRAFVCPEPDGFFPADDECSGSYYTCVNGNPYPQQCPGISVFDPAIDKCVNLEDASCYVSPFTCPTTGGFYPVPGACGSEYYVCIDGDAFISGCPNSAVFDPVTYECTSSEVASCNQPFNCTSGDGLFAYPEACSGIYYNCSNGQSSLQYCPGGFLFDPEVLNCVENANASCAAGSTTTGPFSTTTEMSTTPFLCPENGYFPIPGNCSHYWICDTGIQFPAPCPDGLVFNPNSSFCDYPENVPECSVSTFSALMEIQQVGYIAKGNLAGSMESMVPHLKKQFTCPNDGFFALKEGGTFQSYFACIEGVAYPKACPRRTVFEPVKSVCVPL